MNQIYTKSVIGIGALIDRFTASQCSPINLDPKVGDFVRIGFEISEGQKTRIQFYQGLVLGVKGVGITRSILVRRSFKGFCSERVVLLNSPQIKEFKILTHNNVRRSKLYYVRQLQGKQARILAG